MISVIGVAQYERAGALRMMPAVLNDYSGACAPFGNSESRLGLLLVANVYAS